MQVGPKRHEQIEVAMPGRTSLVAQLVGQIEGFH
jgi:hypothetical protein